MCPDETQTCNPPSSGSQVLVTDVFYCILFFFKSISNLEELYLQINQEDSTRVLFSGLLLLVSCDKGLLCLVG